MEYKYENVEEVVAKRDFEAFRHDEEGELISVITIPKGCKGVVESMGWSSIDDFKKSYDILFIEGDIEINVSIHEENWELYLEILKYVEEEQH